jgi:uncharacterized phage-like protein YoqJ
MGKYKKGILGSFRGIIGTVIGSIWNGIHYLRSLPEASGKNPSTEQLNTRLRFSLSGSFVKVMKSHIAVGYQSFTDGITPANAANAYHLKKAITGIAPDYKIDFTKVILSVGDLNKANNTKAVPAANGEINFEWEASSSSEYEDELDQATFVVYHPERNEVVSARRIVPRSALKFKMTVPFDFEGAEVHCWMYFVSPNGKSVSISSYLGKHTVL